MTTNAGLGSEPEHVLTIDRMLDAPVEKLWRCWTEPWFFQQWFCPRPWYVTDVRMDLRPGGEFHSANSFDRLAAQCRDAGYSGGR